MAQGYNARLDESLGAKHGKKSQSMKSRRDESKAMSKKDYGHAKGCPLNTSRSPRDREESGRRSSAGKKKIQKKTQQDEINCY